MNQNTKMDPDVSDDAELDKLLTELEKPVEETNNSEKIKDKQAEETLEKILHKKPDWANKKDDDYNTYEYVEKDTVDDDAW